jgi:hypothetical protein
VLGADVGFIKRWWQGAGQAAAAAAGHPAASEGGRVDPVSGWPCRTTARHYLAGRPLSTDTSSPSASTSSSAAGRATAHVPMVDEGLVAQLVSEALAIFVRSILTEIYLCHTSSCQEVEGGNAPRRMPCVAADARTSSWLVRWR